VSTPVALSDQEIIDRCQSGELVHDIGRTVPEADDPSSLLNRCIALHNSGQLELLRLTGTPQFAALSPTHTFFTLQHFLGEAIPKLDTPAEPLMRAVRALVEKAGDDLAGPWYGLARRRYRRGRQG
jgi:hypothetical protein